VTSQLKGRGKNQEKKTGQEKKHTVAEKLRKGMSGHGKGVGGELGVKN